MTFGSDGPAPDQASLRRCGFSEEAIVDIALLCAYRHFVARVASGVGIALDGDLGVDARLAARYSYSPDKALEDSVARRDRVARTSPPSDAALAGTWSRGEVPGPLMDALSVRPAAADAIDKVWRWCADPANVAPAHLAQVITAGAVSPDVSSTAVAELIGTLTDEPNRVNASSIREVSEAGLSDAAILAIIATTGLFNGLFRLANALGAGSSHQA